MASRNFYTIDSYDKLFAKCNGTTTTFVDSSTANPKTITANGNATQLSIPEAFEGKRTAGFFNGTTDYVLVPNHSDFNWGTGDYEVQVYTCWSGTPGTYSMILERGSNNFNLEWTAGYMYVYQAGNARISYSFTPTTNVWYKWKVKRVSGVTTLYKDDVAVGTPYSGSDNITASVPLSIGCSQAGAGNFFNGWMKNLTITKAGTTVLDMRFDSPANSPLGPAIYFDGTGDYLSLATSTDFNVGTGDFTYEGWYNLTTVGTKVFFDTTYISGFQLYFTTTSVGVFVANTNCTFTYTPIANKWFHVAIVRSSGTVKVYVDGRALDAGQTMAGSVSNSSSVYISGDQAHSYCISGSMRELRFSNSARYTSNFTPSQTGFTVDANTKLYIKGNENNGVTSFVDSETSPKTITTNGDTKIKYYEDYRSCIFKDETGKFPYPQGSAKVDFFAPFGTGVGYFDGASTTSISCGTSSDWTIGTGDFTQEVYFRLKATTTGCFIEIIDYASTGMQIYQASGTSIGVSMLGSAIFATSQTLLTNVWYHLALSRSGTSLKMWLNGTQIDSATNSSNISTTGGIYVGRNNAGNYLNTLMDNVRISKGIARYTATFNPPEWRTGGNKIMWVI